MSQYRIPELDVSTRLSLAIEMLLPIPHRPWGRVTELSQAHGVSRTFLYDLRERALQALMTALSPHKPGPKPETASLIVDKSFLDRAIAVLPMLKGSIRDIQWGLELLFGVHRSVGYISQTLQEAGAAAAASNASLSVPLPVSGEADEIFQGRRPCLTIVDGRSFLVLHLSPADSRDGTTWGLALLDLEGRGVRFQDLASDGARGIRAGLQEAELAVPLRPDLFHLLQDAQRVSRRLERAAYQAIQLADRARRAEQEAQVPKRRRGRPLKVALPREEAEAREAEAISTYDLWTWLIGEVRQALEPITPEGKLARVAEVRATVETAAELMRDLHHKEVTAFARELLDHLEELLAPLAWLEQSLTPWQEQVDSATEATILWAWQHRVALGLEAGEGFPEPLRPAVQAYWEALSLFHRSSSLAESLHSWLRPYLQIHRGAPQWLLPLLQWFWNHHTFRRGRRAGKSPLELAGVGNAPSLAEALDQLLCPEPRLMPELSTSLANAHVAV